MPNRQQYSRPNRLSEPTYQYSLFEGGKTEEIVNIASVPHRSPFRYPGGKTWFIPRLRRWLNSLPQHPREFIEPFAGGGIAGLTVAFENLAEKVIMVEKDLDVASVWQTTLEGQAEWLANEIANFSLTEDAVDHILAEYNQETHRQAFQTLVKNRVSHGGILAPGSGRIRHGENGRGIASRWYPQTLKRRILDIATIAQKIDFICGDGLEVLKSKKNHANCAFFLDPPYTASEKKAGSRLYRHNALDHEELFSIAESLESPFLMTYDHAPEIEHLARKHNFDTMAIPMKNTHHARMSELLIGKDLHWA